MDTLLDTTVLSHAMASFRKTSAGKWQAIIRQKGHPTTSKVFSKKALAASWARQEEERLERAELSPVADKTLLSALIDWYLDEFTPRKRASQSETSHLNIVSKHIGHLALSAVSANAIIDYVDDRLDEGVGSDTIRKELNKLSVVIDAGMALKDIDLPANPVHKAKSILKVTKTLKPGKRRDRRPTSKELKVLLGSHLSSLVEFAIETAMRRGELANILPGHIDGKTLYIPETKTDRARTISLSPRALELLGDLDLDKLEEGVTIWGIRPDSMTQAFRRVCAANDIADLRLHDMRHEGTSRLFEKGLGIEEVASITGHEDWVSLKRYTHLCPKALAEKL